MTTRRHVRRPAARTAVTRRWATTADGLRAARRSHAARRHLERELATYRTPAEVTDLLAVVRGTEDSQDTLATESSDHDAIRSILVRHLQDAGSSTRLAS